MLRLSLFISYDNTDCFSCHYTCGINPFFSPDTYLLRFDAYYVKISVVHSKCIICRREKNEKENSTNYIMFNACCIVMFSATGCGYSENEAINPEPGWNQDDNDDDDYEDIDDNDNNDNSDDDDDYEDIDDGEGEPEFDGWGFANSGLDTYAGVNGYYISGKDLDRLTSELTETEKKNLLNSYYYVHNYNKDNSYNMNEYEPWDGSCYGMSMTSILHARGLLSTDELHGSSTLEETTLTKENLSAINY